VLQPYTVAPRPDRTRGRPGDGRLGQYNDDEILDAIRRWANQYGEPPTSTDWEPARAQRTGQSWRAERFELGEWPTVRMVRARFGSFNAAVRGAGLRARRAPTRPRPNLTGPAAITDAIVEWTRRYGDVPSMADWDPVRARVLGQEWRVQRYHDGDWPSARSVAHHFGSFAAAVAAAGLVPRERSATREHRDAARRHNRLSVATARSGDGPADAAVVADAVRVVAESRRSGDPVALHAALLDLAAAALGYAEAIAGD
jgi:hypothetical protein